MDYVKSIWANRKLIMDLSNKDFNDKYLGSFLGVVWAFIQPTTTILIFWFLFQVGFRSLPVDNVPYILWLISGMLPWFYFSECLMNATNAIVENRYLVKNVVFKVKLLPFVKIVSSLYIHLFFIMFLIAMYTIYGIHMSIYWVQIIYYILAMILLLIGITFLTSSILVFFKDLGHILAMILQFGFWITPIFWSLKMIPSKYYLLIKLNPFYYIVEGYRETFIYKVWFWEHPGLSAYYWLFVIILLLVGSNIFKKLRPHFADMM